MIRARAKLATVLPAMAIAATMVSCDGEGLRTFGAGGRGGATDGGGAGGGATDAGLGTGGATVPGSGGASGGGTGGNGAGSGGRMGSGGTSATGGRTGSGGSPPGTGGSRTGGSGSGGAAPGSGGRMGTAGSPGGTGGSGSGGAPGASCATISEQYQEELQNAKRCTVGLRAACQHRVAASLMCGCTTFVHVREKLDELATEWAKAGCDKQSWICPAIACIAPMSGQCVATSTGATTGMCQDNSGVILDPA